MADLIGLYRKGLESFSVVEKGPEGFLHVKTGDEYDPVNLAVSRHGKIVKLPIVLPTSAVLKQEEDGTKLKFHPLAESSFADRSEIFNFFQLIASGRLCAVVIGLATHLIDLALKADTDKYNNALLKLLSNMPPVKREGSAKIVKKYFDRLLKENTFITGEKAVVRFNVGRKRRPDVTGLRWAEVSVPVLEEKGVDELKIFGVKAPSKTAYETAIGSFKAIFDGVLNGHMCFLEESGSQTAPYFQALLKSAKAAFTHINEVNRSLGKFKSHHIETDVDWIDVLLDNATDLAKEVPINFEGNVGSTNPVNAKTASVAEEKVQPCVSPLDPAEKQEQSSTCTPSEGKPMSIVEALRARNKAKESDQPQQLQVEQVKKPEPRPAASQLQVSAPKKLQVENRPRERHVHDALGEPLYYRNGRPVVMSEQDIPRGLFIIERDHSGAIVYHDGHDAPPVLVTVTEQELDYIGRSNAQQHQQRQGYGHSDPRERYAYGQGGGYRADPRDRFIPGNRSQYGNQQGDPYGSQFGNRQGNPYGNRQGGFTRRPSGFGTNIKGYAG